MGNSHYNISSTYISTPDMEYPILYLLVNNVLAINSISGHILYINISYNTRTDKT